MLVPASRAEAEFREKGSRFLGVVARVGDEGQAGAFVAEQEKEHPDATHVCYAWRIDENHWRTGDAGEPHGTAGPPILDAIRERGLQQAAVVVVRWYGGVKLGKGGLARAYRESARQVLDASGAQEVTDTVEVAFVVALSSAGRVPATVARHAGSVQREQWRADCVRYRVVVPRDRAEELRADLRDATAGAISEWEA